MIQIENVEVSGWQAAIRGARNPMNSWDKMDSFDAWDCARCGLLDTVGHCNPREDCSTEFHHYHIGPNDLQLLRTLANAGPDHGKYLRMITVSLDVVAPLYWWKEADTYKVGTVADSCSTMHKIHAKEFTLEDFSHEHLYWMGNGGVDSVVECAKGHWLTATGVMELVVSMLNLFRERYLKTHNKDDWWQLIQLLPSSYNQRRTFHLNYAVLRSMYHARKHHKLDEWREFCRWIETLPYAELITGGTADE